MTPTTETIIRLLQESDSWILSHDEHKRLDDYLETVRMILLSAQHAQQEGTKQNADKL